MARKRKSIAKMRQAVLKRYGAPKKFLGEHIFDKSYVAAIAGLPLLRKSFVGATGASLAATFATWLFGKELADYQAKRKVIEAFTVSLSRPALAKRLAKTFEEKYPEHADLLRIANLLFPKKAFSKSRRIFQSSTLILPNLEKALTKLRQTGISIIKKPKKITALSEKYKNFPEVITFFSFAEVISQFPLIKTRRVLRNLTPLVEGLAMGSLVSFFQTNQGLARLKDLFQQWGIEFKVDEKALSDILGRFKA